MCNDQMCSNYQKNKNKKTSLVTTPPEYSHLQSSTQKGFLWSDQGVSSGSLALIEEK